MFEHAQIQQLLEELSMASKSKRKNSLKEIKRTGGKIKKYIVLKLCNEFLFYFNYINYIC